MSRTYRAKRGDQYGARPWGWSEFGPYCWRYNDETVAAHFHSDCYHRDGKLGQTLKGITNSYRRADTRAQLFKVKTSEEEDFANRERLYRGIRWYYD